MTVHCPSRSHLLGQHKQTAPQVPTLWPGSGGHCSTDTQDWERIGSFSTHSSTLIPFQVNRWKQTRRNCSKCCIRYLCCWAQWEKPQATWGVGSGVREPFGRGPELRHNRHSNWSSPDSQKREKGITGLREERRHPKKCKGKGLQQ